MLAIHRYKGGIVEEQTNGSTSSHRVSRRARGRAAVRCDGDAGIDGMADALRRFHDRTGVIVGSRR